MRDDRDEAIGKMEEGEWKSRLVEADEGSEASVLLLILPLYRLFVFLHYFW
jgi:hypothetical protein